MQNEFRSVTIVVVLVTLTIVWSHAIVAAPASGDACSLLSKQDAAAALGGMVNGPIATAPQSSGPGMTVTSCEYTSGDHKVHLNLMNFTADVAAIYKRLCAQKSKEGLSGLGDVACWYNDKHEELQVLKGNAFFSIELRGKNQPTEPIKEVARKVFNQLK